MENLTAFVRERSRRNEAEPDEFGDQPATDIAAVLTVIKAGVT